MNTFLERIKEADTIGIAGHIRPDGDSVGACMGLYNYLKDNFSDKKVEVFLEKVPQTFQFLKGAEDIITDYPDRGPYDLFISLDSSSIDRLGLAQKYFEAAKRTVCVDHHVSNTSFAMENIVEDHASSTCEILYTLMEEEKIGLSAAEPLYIGIIFDTGVFKHSNTSARTMNIAGILMEKGVPFSKLIDECFYQRTNTQTQLLGRALLASMRVLDNRCIFSVISQRVLEFYEGTPEDLDGVIDELRVTKGVEVAILLYEIGEQQYKVSMRSNNQVDVSRIAVFFGGGGHVKAAGCTMSGSFRDVINNLTEHIEKQLDGE